MVERHAVRHAANTNCSVSGCDEPAIKSVSWKEANEKAGLGLKSGNGRAHLCKSHYRAFKKATKTDRELERLAW